MLHLKRHISWQVVEENLEDYQGKGVGLKLSMYVAVGNNVLADD